MAHPCHSYACRIQDCITRTGKESYCLADIMALYECCTSFYEKNGASAETPSCPEPAILATRKKELQAKLHNS
ncbi:hypothetical protein CANCADRAFT_32723 [Tortispora caseinolytica NRRL Y-17796]|uniref:Cx9C motif-containing protein 4, mitochondrial n=1 Tax=Tortispora caseinolytica NRRL Y-17796 TaxID=767744 RepID=A0A1E4TCI4_9ASCO|nr:hypothetical protein CANCADRAFT_32723 [Tortispora caseinolytica NRRL Y-17796]